MRKKKTENGPGPGKPGDRRAIKDAGLSGAGNNEPVWNRDEKRVHCPFPGSADAHVSLRIAMERDAYSEVTAHVHNSISTEVCGVLIGDLCEDEHGEFVHIQHIIAGASARESSAHVTFTQETWNQIHGELDKKYPDSRIVGWYHSHPGFGVTFSDMDLFIQKNFFSSPTQCALVIDPLGGDMAVCINGDGGAVYIDRMWIDGKEKRLFIPASAPGEPSSTPDLAYFRDYLGALESRVGRIVRALDMQQRSVSRMLLAMGILAGLMVVFFIGYMVFRHIDDQFKPPELAQYVPVPLKIGNDTALLGICIVDWRIPPNLLAMHSNFEKEQLQALEKSLKESLQKQDDAKKSKPQGWFSSFIEYIKKPFVKKGK